MSHIVIVGSINMDVVTQVERHPRGGETVIGKRLHYIPGGKGANQAVAASRLGNDVMLVGRVGKDGFGESLLRFLQKESLNTQFVRVSETTPTGIALITVSDDSENTIVIVAGSNAEVSAMDIADIPLVAGDIALSPFEIPQDTIYTFFERARAVGGITVLNPAPAMPFIQGLHRLVDYLIVNETELAFFANSPTVPDNPDDIEKMANQLLTDDNQAVIVTLGAKGAFCVTHQKTLQVPGYPVNAIDTTGAGDCFTGAVAVGLSEGLPLAQILDFANKAASLSVQKIGASSSLPFRSDLS